MEPLLIGQSSEQAFLMCLIRAPKLYEEVRFLIKKNHFTLIKSQKLFDMVVDWISINKDDIKSVGYDEFISYVEIQYSDWFDKNKPFLLEASAKIVDADQAIEKWKHYYRILEKYYFYGAYREIVEKSIIDANKNPLDIKRHIQDLQTNVTRVFSGMNLLDADSSLSTVIDKFREEYLLRLDPDFGPSYFGLTALDELHGGLYPSTYNLITARSSVGKSALSLCATKNMLVKQGKKVAFFNLETDNYKFLLRWFAPELGINSRQLKDPKTLTVAQRDMFFKKQEELLERYQNKLHLVDDLYETNQIIDKLFSIKNAFGLDVVFIDLIEYVKIRGNFENGQKKLAAISDEFFQVRKKLDVAICMIQQQNQKGDQMAGQSSGRGAEDPYLQSDSSLGLYKYQQDDGKIDENKRTIVVNKNRDGETGTVSVRFAKEFTLFEDDILGGTFND